MIRNCDLLTENQDLEIIYTYKNFPVFMGTSVSSIETDVLQDLNIGISLSSGLIQITNPAPIYQVYKTSHGSGTVGSSWKEHHEKFAKFLYESNPTKILEIGSHHTILYENFKKLSNNIDWTIIDVNIEKKLGIKTINLFFDEFFETEEKYDTIVHSHLIEHVYDINKFLLKCKSILKKNGNMMFSIPNMSEMIKKFYTNCMNFEHTFLLSEDYLELFLYKHGFSIIKKEYFREEHSIFYTVTFSGHTKKYTFLQDEYLKNKTIFLKYVEYQKKLVEQYNTAINNFDGDIYLFGAHAVSQYLISYGLNTDKIKFILDNDINKLNTRLCGSNLRVTSPLQELSNQKSSMVILRSGTFNNEIKHDILNNINNKIIFIE